MTVQDQIESLRDLEQNGCIESSCMYTVEGIADSLEKLNARNIKLEAFYEATKNWQSKLVDGRGSKVAYIQAMEAHTKFEEAFRAVEE